MGTTQIGVLPALSNQANPVDVEREQEKQLPSAETEVKVPCEVFSRIVGYYRPIQNWNKGKQQEFADRKVFHPLIEDTGATTVQAIRDGERKRAEEREAAEKLLLEEGLDVDRVREAYAGDFQFLSYPDYVRAVWAYHSRRGKYPETFHDLNALVLVRVLKAGDDYPPISGTSPTARRTIGEGDISAFSLYEAEKAVRAGLAEYLLGDNKGG